ncbi:MAG: AbrB family transcriptional regulator [Rhizobiales bacterium]|nr:AbrB family transcriptional regulator [Hyphomicrobiales bacterium]
MPASAPEGRSMPLPKFNWPSLRRTAETLIIATIGGFGFHMAGFPAGFVSGSMAAVALAALLGRPCGMPNWLTRLFFLAIGISLGTVVTPETLQGMAAAPFSIGVLAVTTIAITAGSTYYLIFVHKWTPVSALLAASPGALAQVLALATEFKADVRAIVIVQSVRVLILGVGLPGSLSLLGFESVPIERASKLGLADSMIELAILVAVSVGAAYGLQWLRFPGGILFGSLLGSAVLHGTGWIEVALPPWLAYSAMIGCGAVAGSRFSGMTLRMLMQYLGAAAGSFAVAMVIVCAVLAVLLPILPVPVPDLVVSFAPGAQETMLIMALALHLDPVFIGAHHLARFIIVSIGIPVVVKLISGPPAPPAQPKPPQPPTGD